MWRLLWTQWTENLHLTAHLESCFYFSTTLWKNRKRHTQIGRFFLLVQFFFFKTNKSDINRLTVLSAAHVNTFVGWKATQINGSIRKQGAVLMHSKLLSYSFKTCSVLWLLMAALKTGKKMHSLCSIWVCKAVCACESCASGGRLGTVHK